MNTWQKIIVGGIAALVWILTIPLSHLYPDMAAQIAQVQFGAQNILLGLGVWHMKSSNDPKAQSDATA